MSKLFKILLRSAILIELMISIGECKSSKSASGDHNAQEQRLALHIITSSPESDTSSSRRLDRDNSRYASAKLNSGVSYDPMESQPSLDWHQSDTATINQQSAPKRIVINLNHNTPIGKNNSNFTAGPRFRVGVSPLHQRSAADHNQSARIGPYSGDPSKQKLAQSRTVVSEKRGALLQKTASDIEEKPKSRKSIREVIMNSVRQQGGVPAVIVDDESQLGNSEQARGKLMLGAEMVDRMMRTNLDDSGTNKDSIELENQPAELNTAVDIGGPSSLTSEGHEQRNSFTSGGQTAEKQWSSSDQIDLNNDPDNNEINNNQLLGQNLQNLRPRQVDETLRTSSIDDLRAISTRSSKDHRKADSKQDNPKGSFASANHREVSWRNSDDHLDGGNSYAFRLDPKNGNLDVVNLRDNENFDLSKLDSKTKEQKALTIFGSKNDDGQQEQGSDDANHDSVLQAEKEAMNHFRRDPTQSIVTGRTKQILRTSDRQLSNTNVEPIKDGVHLGDLPSANGMRILVAIDGSDLTNSADYNKRSSQQRNNGMVSRHQKSDSQKQISSTRIRNPTAMSDRIAGFLDRLKLYTTRDQLMKVVNEMQQYPDRKKAENMSKADDQDDAQIHSAPSLKEHKTLGTSYQVRHMTRTIPVKGQKTTLDSIRNNVPAPISDEYFSDSLVTSASQHEQDANANSEDRYLGPEHQHESSKSRGNFLNRKAELRTRIRPEETDNDTDSVSNFGSLVMANVDDEATKDVSSHDEEALQEDRTQGNPLETDEPSEYTKNEDLLNTMEASEKSYNTQDDSEVDDGQTPDMIKSIGGPAKGSSGFGGSEDNNQESANNEREGEEIKILEQLIDELVAAEKDRKKDQSRASNY